MSNRRQIAFTPCGARNRAGLPCRAPAMKNGRCKNHGGKSAGPTSPEGLLASQTARLVHGRNSRRARLVGAILKELNVLASTLTTNDLEARFASWSRYLELEQRASYKVL